MWCCQSEGTLQSKQHGLLTCIRASHRYVYIYIKHTFSILQCIPRKKNDAIVQKWRFTRNPYQQCAIYLNWGPWDWGNHSHMCIYIYIHTCKSMYICICTYFFNFFYSYNWWPQKKTYLFASKLVLHFKDTWTKSTSLSTCFSGERRPTKITKGRSGRPLLHNLRLRLSPLVEFGFLVIVKTPLGYN